MAPVPIPSRIRPRPRQEAILSVPARLANLAILSGSLVVARALRRRRRRWNSNGTIALVGTFLNQNWLIAHVTPLARSAAKKVIVVADEPLVALERVEFACPPRWLSRCAGRAFAKLVWLMVVGLRHRPDLYIGYYIVPSGLTALVVGRVLGRPACYQMTGGPLELLGGGWATENRLQKALGGPSPLVERLARRVVAEFELVVVRGERARAFVSSCGAAERTAVITGAIDSKALRPSGPRDFDLAYVSRLTDMKRPLDFLEIVDRVRRRLPAVRAVLVGAGPLMEAVRTRVRELGLADRVEITGATSRVAPLLQRARVFVLTSESEGLSIAAAEAMAAGAVPVMSDVGELSGLVCSGENGYLVPVGDIGAFVDRALSLLLDAPLWATLSPAAVAAAERSMDVAVVAERWRECLAATYARCGAEPEAEGASFSRAPRRPSTGAGMMPEVAGVGHDEER